MFKVSSNSPQGQGKTVPQVNHILQAVSATRNRVKPTEQRNTMNQPKFLSPPVITKGKEMAKKFGAKSTADEVLSDIDLKGERFLITGASSGIGRETARSLVFHGASVVGAVRNLAKAEPATASVRDAASQGGGNLELIDLDLASLQSVRACADKLLADGQPFDAIIANAGVMATLFGRTIDGFEVQFGTNHLGHFALINGIEPLLAENGRLVVLSSLAHRGADIDLDDPNFEQQAYDPWVAYSRSKTANSLFAVEFDRRHRFGPQSWRIKTRSVDIISKIARSHRLMTRPTRLPTVSGRMRSTRTKPSSFGRKVRN